MTARKERNQAGRKRIKGDEYGFPTYLDHLKGLGHHGDEHVEEDDDNGTVVDAEDPVADVLYEVVLVVSQLHH